MTKSPPSPIAGRRRARAAAVLFAFVAAAAVSAVILLAAQERSRLRIGAEFQAFQIAADLLRAADAEDYQSISRTPGLRAFGIFSRRGETLYRFGEVPEEIDVRNPAAPAHFENGVVSFVRMMGASPQESQRVRRGFFGASGRDDSSGPAAGGGFGPSMGQGMGPGMGMMAAPRFVYVAMEASALRSGERLVYAVSAFFVAAIAAAFALLFSLVRSLDEYRDREARNRELLALGEAARTLAHEIKNPLGVMKIQVALLRKKTGEESRDGLRVIEEEADRLSLLASRVKAFLAADDGTPRPVAVVRALESFAERYGDRLSVEVDGSAAASSVWIDPLRFDQILDNLVSNAIDCMDGRPFVRPELRAEASRGRVRFSVSDAGPGIPSEDGERVFDLFFTTKPSGAGIGLALAKRYAEAARGSLTHRPKPEGGTVFTLDLPEHRGDERK